MRWDDLSFWGGLTGYGKHKCDEEDLCCGFVVVMVVYFKDRCFDSMGYDQ